MTGVFNYCEFMLVKIRFKSSIYLFIGKTFLITIHLSHSGLLFPQTHYDDVVGLSDATLSPRSQRTVRLIQNNPVDVLLLTQPAWQTILMNTEKEIINQINSMSEETKTEHLIGKNNASQFAYYQS